MDKDESSQIFDGSLTDKAVQEKKWEAQQAQRPKVCFNDTDLENVFKFKYLGSLLAANGSQEYDIRARIAMVM